METIPVWRRVLGLPSERTGWWAVGLAASVFVFFGLFLLMFTRAMRAGGDNHWAVQVLALPLVILMLGCGIAGGLVAVWSVVKRRDVSFLVWAAMAWGAFVLFFTLGELSGTH